MPDLQARYNKFKEEYRCGLPDCSALLGKGIIIKGGLQIKCKCGAYNRLEGNEVIRIDIAETQHKPEGRTNGANRNTVNKKKNLSV